MAVLMRDGDVWGYVVAVAIAMVQALLLSARDSGGDVDIG